jgi:hypothetical protein
MREAPRYCIALQDEPLRPVLIDCATKVAKVMPRAVFFSAIPAIIQTMNDGISQGVDKQLMILHTLLSSSPTSPPFTAGYSQKYVLFVLCSFSSLTDGLALVLRFRLHEARAAVVSSTAAATLR